MVEGEDFSFSVELIELCGDLFESLEVGQVVGIARNVYQRDGGTGLFELGGKREAGQARGQREGDQGGRHVEVVERSGHRILAADGGEAQRVLGVEGS